MAALGSQSIASSYEQLLHVDADGGGTTTTHVSVKDGDNGTTFGFTIASDALMMTGTNRLEFGDTGTYIFQSADGVLDLVSDTEIELNGTIDINGAVTMDGGNVTINDDSGDYDFRVESNGNANAFFIEGSSGLVCIGDTANANMTNGLTINMGAADNEILSLKSSDVAHGRTTYTETDTWLNMKKVSNASGGAQLIASMEDAAVGYVMSLTASGGQADTTKSASAHGLVKIWSEEHDGSNTIANITANGNIFAVSGYIGGANTTVFLVDEDGDIHYDGSDAGAYDYAEMFEWEDGNPDNEDRVGYSVSLVGGKIKKAEEGDTVIGIVSAVPAICGDSPLEWQKRYKTDEWGRKVHKEVQCVKFEIQHESEPATYYQEGDELPEGKKVGDEKTAAVYITKEKHYEGDGIPSDLPDDAEYYTKLESQNSDEYDPNQEYIPRKERKEWSPVGLMGKLRMHSGQPTASSWIKMKDEDNDIEMWLIK
jgi:hypothetical protein